jgi:hypothetical protein
MASQGMQTDDEGPGFSICHGFTTSIAVNFCRFVCAHRLQILANSMLLFLLLWNDRSLSFFVVLVLPVRETL